MYISYELGAGNLARSKYKHGTHYNIRCEVSGESTTRVIKGIERRVGSHGDCASLVVVFGVMPFASEYEGQVSSWLPWHKCWNSSRGTRKSVYAPWG